MQRRGGPELIEYGQAHPDSKTGQAVLAKLRWLLVVVPKLLGQGGLPFLVLTLVGLAQISMQAAMVGQGCQACQACQACTECQGCQGCQGCQEYQPYRTRFPNILI